MLDSSRFNPEKPVIRNLLNFKGIGHTKAILICETLGLAPNEKIKNISQVKIDRLSQLLADIKKLTIPTPLLPFLKPYVGSKSKNPAPPCVAPYTGARALSGGEPTAAAAPRQGQTQSTDLLEEKQYKEVPICIIIEGNLIAHQKENILRLISIDCHRGRRRGPKGSSNEKSRSPATLRTSGIRPAPVRGQRTRSNAKTAKKLNGSF